MNQDYFENVCEICGSAPCEWLEYGQDIKNAATSRYSRNIPYSKALDSDGNSISNSEVQKELYQLFTYMKFGHLGRGVRIPIAYCVVREIRSLFPEVDGNYMGFKEN